MRRIKAPKSVTVNHPETITVGEFDIDVTITAEVSLENIEGSADVPNGLHDMGPSIDSLTVTATDDNRDITDIIPKSARNGIEDLVWERIYE